MVNEIIQKYKEGKSISQLLIEYPSYNRRQINKILTENHIVIRGGRKRKELTNNQIEEIKEMIDTKKEILSIKETRMSEYREIKSNLDKIKIYIDEINNISSELDKLDVELEPM